MSWFQPQIEKYEVEESAHTVEDLKNPFIKQVIEEEFVKVPLRQSRAILPTLEARTDDSSREFTNVSGE